MLSSVAILPLPNGLDTLRPPGPLSKLPAPPTKPPLRRSKDHAASRDERETKSRDQWWNVTTLNPPPEYFPLERTSRHISGVGPSEVSSRISDCLRQRSVETKFDHVRGIAKCRTPNYVSFRINLFSCCQDEGDCVIVEVQRRKGQSHIFSGEYRAVLDAAEGKASPKSEDTHTIFLKRPVSQMSCLQSLKVDTQQCSEIIFNQSERMLKQGEHDANMLGMESLRSMTDSKLSTPEVVILASKLVISPDSPQGLNDHISSLLQYGTLKPDQQPYTVANDNNEFNEQMHNLALNVVANALAVTAQDGSLSKAINKHVEWFKKILLPVLIEDIKGAKERVHDAMQAARCLGSLCSCSPGLRILAAEAGCEDALEDVVTAGLDHSELLEKEIKQILVILEGHR